MAVLNRSFFWVNRSLYWEGYVRLLLFWVLVIGLSTLLYALWSSLSPVTLAGIIVEALGGDLTRVSTQAFAFSVAKALACFAFGLLAAYGVLHALLVPLSIRSACNIIQGNASKKAFANNFESVHAQMERHPLLGHAWRKFEESLIPGSRPIQNTQRPQTFFSYAMLRERLVGLKIMPGVPSYFVGAGLLLTFIGLVIALYKAAEGTQAAQLAAGGAGAAAMQSALRDLLQAATFKFATSIAGLASSIVLAFIFRLYVIRIESSLRDFCEAVESKLNFLAPQSISVEMRDSLANQLEELKAINSDEFLARLGQEVAPSFNTALTDAISPLTREIGEAVGKLTENSQSGVQDLLDKFLETLEGGAGTELREVTKGLQTVVAAMGTARNDMGRSGEYFASRISEAAENLNRLVVEAGRSLGQQSEKSRQTLEQMVVSMREHFDQTTRQVDSDLASTAEGASSKLTQVMDRVLAKLEDQFTRLDDRFGGFKETAAGHVDDMRRVVTEAQKKSVEAVAGASAGAAAALEKGLAAAMESIRGQVDEFSSALRTSSTALGAQAQAIDRASLQTRETAELFEKSSQAMRDSVGQVIHSNEKVAAVASTVDQILGRASTALEEGQQATRGLTTSLAAQVERLTSLWTDYERRFGKVDEDLQRAFDKLALETTKQSQLLADRTNQIDKGLASAVDKLAQFVQNIDENTSELADTFSKLKDNGMDGRTKNMEPLC